MTAAVVTSSVQRTLRQLPHTDRNKHHHSAENEVLEAVFFNISRLDLALKFHKRGAAPVC